MEIVGEIWKPIPGFDGIYEASDCGRVRSLDRRVKGARGATMQKRGVMLKHKIDKDGYPCVVLCRDGFKAFVSVHRLVLGAFVGPCPSGMEACHRDGIPSNNSLNNLRWDTHASNEADKTARGTVSTGSKNPNAKLTERCALEIIDRIFRGESQRSIASRFGLAKSTVGKIARGETWSRFCVQAT